MIDSSEFVTSVYWRNMTCETHQHSNNQHDKSVKFIFLQFSVRPSIDSPNEYKRSVYLYGKCFTVKFYKK